MDLKKQGNQNKSGELRTDAVKRSDNSPFNEEQFTSVYQRAQEQIKAIEQKIASERELWYSRIKQKEEDQVSLKSQLDMLVYKVEQERKKREGELSILHQQIQKDLSGLERSIGEEVKAWTDKISQKDKELEEIKHQSVFVETQKKLEVEKNIRGLQASLENTKQKYKAIERQLIDEKNQWIARLKSREEEISSLKAQISLKEIQIKSEDEKSQAKKKDLQITWQSQTKELEEKLEKLKKDWSNNYRNKEEELFTLKIALEEHLSRIRLEAENQEKDIVGMQGRIEGRISILEKSLLEEANRWQEMLNVRETEFKELKAELVLKESQEKAEREARFKELKEDENLAGRKLKDINQRIEQEKENWKVKIAQKDEELKVLKIQSEVKLKELQDEWINKESKSKQDKEELAERLKELENKLSAETKTWQEELKVKDEEIKQYGGQWKSRQDEIVNGERLRLEDLKKKKVILENELRTLEESFVKEKNRWEELLRNQEKEVDSYKNEAVSKELKIKRDIADFEHKLNLELDPFVQRVKTLQADIDVASSEFQKQIAVKEAQKASLQNNFSKEEEKLRNKISVHVNKIKAQEDVYRNKVSEVTKLIETLSQSATEKLEKLKAQKETLSSQLSSIETRITDEKARLLEDYKKRKAELENTIATLEVERRDVKKNMELKLSQRIKDLENEEVKIKELEARIKNEAVQKESELKTVIAKGEEELEGLKSNLENAKKEYNKRIKAREDEINALFGSLKDNESKINTEKVKIETELSQEIQAVLLKRRELEAALIKEKKAYEKEVIVIDGKIAALRQNQELKQKDYETMQAMWQAKIAETKTQYNKKIDDLHLNRDDANQLADEMIERLEKEEIEMQQSLINSKSKYLAETNSIKEKYELKKNELNGLVDKLNIELEELKKTITKDLVLRNSKFEEEENKLNLIVSKADRDRASWEKEFSDINAGREKDVNVLMANMGKTREEFSKKIRSQENRILNVQQKIKDDQILRESEMKNLNDRLSADSEPLLEKCKELKGRLTQDKENAEIELSGLDKKIVTLKQKHAEMEANYGEMYSTWKQRLDKAKQDYEKEISSLRSEQLKVEEEHKKEIENQEISRRTIEKQSFEQQEVFKKQREVEINRFKAQIEKTQEDIRGLELEIRSIENRHPQIIKTKNDEIANLEKQINEREVFYRQEQEKAQKDIESYQKKSEEKISKLKENIEGIKVKYKIELDEINKKYAELMLELEKKSREKKEELINEEKKYFEQKSKLEKQKNELTENLKNTKMISQEQLRQKEKEILALQSELSEKEKAWEQSWQQKEKEFAQEKQALMEEVENLSGRLKEEEETLSNKAHEKESEIEQLKQQYGIRFKKLEEETSNRKVSWEQTNTGLSGQVLTLSEKLGAMQKGYEEAISLKEKDLQVLKSNLEFWEIRSKTNEEKRVAAWEEEKTSLENRIKETSAKLNTLEKEYSAILEEKDKVIIRVSEEARQAEEEKASQWKQVEIELSKQNEHLSKEVESWQERVKQESAVSENKIKTLERELERLKLESSLKDTMMQTDEQKMDREYRKMQQKLKEELMGLEHRMAEEKEDWLSKIRLKEDEISTLKVRLNMREERSQNEVKKREEEIKRIIGELENELGALQDDYNKKIPNKKEKIETMQEELNSILKDIREKERQWLEKQETRNKTLAESYANLNGDIEKLEKELNVEGQRMSELLVAKEKQIQSLTEQMSAKENDLKVEREFTQEIVRSLKLKAQDFKRVLKRRTDSERTNKADEANRSFEMAIDSFSSGKYAEAKIKLEHIISVYPDFSGAYKYLALCYFNLGQKEEALKTARKALELEPQNEELENWIRSIKEIN